MSTPLTVSIALATYNGERHLRDQLESLSAQSVLPTEVVLTDDCSTDRTIEIAKEFAATAPFEMRIYRNEQNLGFTDNFFKAAALCKGELIAFCDQDDVWLNRKLATCTAPFADPDVWICVHTARLWYGGSNFGGYVPHFRKRRILPAAAAYPLCNYLGFANVIRRCVLTLTDNRHRPRHPSIVKSVSSEPHMMVHDQWIWFIASIFGKAAFIPEVQCHYRQHVGNTVGFAYENSPLQKKMAADKALQFAKSEEVTAECADFIAALGATLSSELRARAATAAERMRARANIYRLRKQIYLPEARPTERVRSFIEAVDQRGYFGGSPDFSFGPQALLKDLLIGVPGVQTLLRR